MDYKNNNKVYIPLLYKVYMENKDYDDDFEDDDDDFDDEENDGEDE